MKNIKIYIIGLLLLTGVVSCEEETDDVSFVTSYPEFFLEGGSVFSVVSGATFNDPGVQAFEGEKELDISVSGTVDTNTPGLYTLIYSATNSDGFDGTATRQVVVTAEDVSETDLSGNYERDTNGTPTTITKVANGYYFSTNLWVDSNGVSGNFIHIGGSDIIVPIQSSRFGRYQGNGIISDTGLSMSFTLLDPPNTGVTLNRTMDKL